VLPADLAAAATTKIIEDIDGRAPGGVPGGSKSFLFKSLKIQKLEGKPKNIWKIFLVQLTQVHPKFDPISVQNGPLSSMK
jgi:hypothetical protein